MCNYVVNRSTTNSSQNLFSQTLAWQGRADPACRADRLPKFENSKMPWNYREVIICMYRIIDVRASHYKINPAYNVYRLDKLTVLFSAYGHRLSALLSVLFLLVSDCAVPLQCLWHESVTLISTCLIIIIQSVQTEYTDRLWFHPRVARPSLIATSQWPLHESGTLFGWPSRRCSHCQCSSDSWRLCCLPAAMTVNNAMFASRSRLLIC